jgi:hypothetical protein
VTLDIRATLRGALAGLLAGAVGVCVGFLISGFSGPVGSPVVAVGEVSIDLSPPPVKNFAIREFGSHDKVVLQIGVLVVLAVFAAVIGVLAQRRESYGLIGVAIFGAVGLSAAGTRPTATATDLLPSLIGAAAAAFALVGLTRAGSRAPARRASGGMSEPARRQFMTLGAVAAGGAAVSYLGGRLLTERASVSAAVSSLRLPAPTTPAPPLPDGVNLRIPGLSPFVTSNSAFYRVDTAIVLPQIPPSSWRLRIHGMVSRELTL